MPSRILVFDVIETLIATEPLDSYFQEVFADSGVRHQWFAHLIACTGIVSLTGEFRKFSELAVAALEATARERSLSLTGEERARLIEWMTELPAQPDAVEGLDRLQRAGFRMVTLSNSGEAALEEMLATTKLERYFERNFSVESVGRYKPAPEVYEYAARELGVAPDRLRLVAAHGFDIAGALHAGYAAAFVARRGKGLLRFAPAPDISGRNLIEVADAIIAHDGRGLAGAA
jgi:2-haloacid dehalogenase